MCQKLNLNFKHSQMENEKQEPFDYEKAKQKVKEQFIWKRIAGS
jgi:hypothetical protein